MKKFISICMMIGLVILGTSSVALANEKTTDAEELSGLVKVTFTNAETEKVVYFEPEEVRISSQESLMSSSSSANQTMTCSVFIPLESNNEGIMPASTVTGGQENSGVTANMAVNYDYDKTNNLLRVNSVSGSWTPSSSYYYLGNREVGAHAGSPNKLVLNKYPTTNTYSYTTGWGYVPRYWDTFSARAWSEADIYISGMSGTAGHITVEFTFPNE